LGVAVLLVFQRESNLKGGAFAQSHARQGPLKRVRRDAEPLGRSENAISSDGAAERRNFCYRERVRQ
jgi:hypothetical protein